MSARLRYAAVLRSPYVARLLTTALISRAPVGVNGLAIVLFMRAETGSYATAGAVAGFYAVGAAIVAPFLGRLVDRTGAPRVLLPLAIAHGVFLGYQLRRRRGELHVTQSAVSRQIKGLEDELGAPLFTRGTRHVQITPDGQTLLRAVEPLLAKLDTSVQHIRHARSRRRVSVTTFASFGSLWLLPRIEAFQRQPSRHRHPRLGHDVHRRPRRP